MEPGAKDQPARIPAGPVELRPHRADDIDGVFDQCSDPTFQRWTTVPLPYTRAHAEEFVRHRVPLGWQQGDYLAFAIADAATGEYLGTVDLTLTGTGGAEVGYGLRPSARGKGAMTAAVRAVVEWAFAAQGLALGILHWRSHVGNWPSRRVAWRTGFRLEGAIRGMCVSRGRRYDGWIASLRPQDPREPAAPWYDVPVLRSPTCVLRPFRLGDADAVVEGCTDPVTQYWLGGLPTPYTKTDALGYIQSRDEEQASGRGIYWAVADPVTDQCIGSFGLMDIDRATEFGRDRLLGPSRRAGPRCGHDGDAAHRALRRRTVRGRRAGPPPADAARRGEQPRLAAGRGEGRVRKDGSAARRRTSRQRHLRGPRRL